MSLDRTSSLTPEQLRRRRRLTLEVLWVCTIALVPWAVYLGISLPHEYSARHWDLAWSGFDGLEILALGATAYYGWRGRQALIATALASATLLICDAWFDISLDLGTPAIWGSLFSALFLELPLAFFLIHRVRLLLRLTLLRLYPEGDEKGRPMSLGRLPLLVGRPEAFLAEAMARRAAGAGATESGAESVEAVDLAVESGDPVAAEDPVASAEARDGGGAAADDAAESADDEPEAQRGNPANPDDR